MAAKIVVVLGGGTGGLVAARRLRRMLPPEHRVILVDRRRTVTFAPSYLWLMLGWRTIAAIQRDLAHQARRGVEYIQADIQRIDLANARVYTSAGELPYDELVVALGADLAPQAIPGMAEASFNLYDVDGADRLRRAVAGFQGGTIGIIVSGVPYKCPPAPFEAALLLDYHLRQRGLRDRTSIHVFSPDPFPVPVVGRASAQAIVDLMQERGIEYHPAAQVTDIDPATREPSFEGPGAVSGLRCGLVIAVPPHRPPAVVGESGLSGETPWIEVDKGTLRTKHEHVHAIGDVTLIRMANGLPLPKAGVFAHGEAETVAHNLAVSLTGQGEPVTYGGRGICFLETGYDQAGLVRGNFLAEPAPQVKLRPPSRLYHVGKLLFEKYWLYRWWF